MGDRMHETLYAHITDRYYGVRMDTSDTKYIRALKLLALMCRFDGYMVNADVQELRQIKQMVAFFSAFKDVPTPVEHFLLKIQDAQLHRQDDFIETFEFLQDKGLYAEAEALKEKFRIPDHEFHACRLALLKSAFAAGDTSIEEEYHRILQDELSDAKENRTNLKQQLDECDSRIARFERDLNNLAKHRRSCFVR